jgi:hypothetical protein
MNALERALIEKAGQDTGWEWVLESRADLVLLGSARHRGRAAIAPGAGACWDIELTGERLVRELARSVSHTNGPEGRLIASDIDQLARLLRRAAELAHALPDQAANDFRERLRHTLSGTEIVGTEAERIVRARIGQDVFRAALMDYWGGACALTGIDRPEVLRASHAKPWADCVSDEERLDVFNGLLLVANLDALFDRGLIGFDDIGALEISPGLTAVQSSALGLDSTQRLRWIAAEHRHYLTWHRQHVFQ